MTLARTELERLATLRSAEGVVSVYIRMDPRLRYDRGQASMKFKGALKRFSREAEERWRKAAERERDRILEFLEGWTPEGRALAIFACEPDSIWETLTLEVNLPTFVSVDVTTNTGLLSQVLDEYPRFAVVVVQRDDATIYTAEQQQAKEITSIKSDVPGQHAQGGWAQARFQRHIEVHMERHLKLVAEELERLYYDTPFQRLAIGGTEEVTKEFLETLPEPLSRLVIGTFTVDFKGWTEEETLARARELLREDERRAERALVERVVGEARSNGRGAAGVSDTLAALLEGRVQTLLVADGVTAEGQTCSECEYFSAERFEACPRCGGAPEDSPDVVERAIEKAYLTGGQVETVFAEAREWLLANGGIAAILRY